MKHLFFFLALLFTLSACSDKEDIYVDDLKIELKDDRIEKPTWLKDVVDKQTADYKQAGYDQPWIDVYSAEKNGQAHILISHSPTSGTMSKNILYHLDGDSCTCQPPTEEYRLTNATHLNSIWASWPY